MPIFVLPKTPPPTPKTTKANEGLFEKPLSRSNSSLFSKPSFHNSPAALTDSGKPQTRPVSQMGSAILPIPNILSKVFPRRPLVFSLKQQFQRSDKMKKGNSVGIIVLKEKRKPLYIEFLSSSPKNIIKQVSAIHINVPKRLPWDVFLFVKSCDVIFSPPNHTFY